MSPDETKVQWIKIGLALVALAFLIRALWLLQVIANKA